MEISVKNSFFTRRFVSAHCLTKSRLCAQSSAEMEIDMDNTLNIMVQYLGVIMFVAAVTIYLGYIKGYERMYDELYHRMVRDTVIVYMDE